MTGGGLNEAGGEREREREKGGVREGGKAGREGRRMDGGREKSSRTDK